MDRRNFMTWGGLAAGAALLTKAGRVSADPEVNDVVSAPSVAGGQVAVVTPNGSTLPLTLVNGVKVGHLVAEAVKHEFTPGLEAEIWGYNGGTPGPTIEAVEGDHLRIYVTNGVETEMLTAMRLSLLRAETERDQNRTRADHYQAEYAKAEAKLLELERELADKRKTLGFLERGLSKKPLTA